AMGAGRFGQVVAASCVMMVLVYLFIFFSSRRRHTRWPRDWSSDVCSSDLGKPTSRSETLNVTLVASGELQVLGGSVLKALAGPRSEERRVGKECRARRWAGQ